MERLCGSGLQRAGGYAGHSASSPFFPYTVRKKVLFSPSGSAPITKLSMLYQNERSNLVGLREQGMSI